jgi:sterol desaturase/sphingolipid hydroxylase (fatty acid hydroxylase superfamily)
MLFDLTDEVRDAAHRYARGEGDPEKRVFIRVFKNGFAEKVLGRAAWWTPIVWFGPLIAYGIHRGVVAHGAARAAAAFLGGWLIWTLTEYLLHRFFFHMKGEGPQGEIRAFMVHGYHHEYPNDRLRLVAPPIMSWGPAVIFAAAYYFLVGGSWSWTLLAGTASGYVAYDWIHYYTHHARPTWPLGKWLRKYHMVHHHSTENVKFGVSSPLWDLVFGTWRG